jgi:eukaryotic-like serine/threonine-protein kinase
MGSPIRMVCGGCLRSVEVVPGDESEGSNSCPYCGGLIDSAVVESEPMTRFTAGRGQSDEAEVRSSETTSDWAGTWSKGSLGSLGRFHLRERLGDGGFGQVYLAFDPRLDRDVALKVLKQPDPGERVMERFFREARAAARLDHPNIVGVHDAGFDQGRCWVAFHFVSGRPLGWYRDHHRLDPPTVAKIMRDLADAVDHAHRQGVLHRDIKPANVLIDDHGRPRLIDFGLARRSDLDSSLTRDGAVVGTPAYMSPEQALGFSRQVDERSDVFSLGVIFFEVLTGQRPYAASIPSGPTETVAPDAPKSRAQVPVPSVRSINAAVPAKLDQICMRAIAQDPRQRYVSARALADDLDHWLMCHKGANLRLSYTMSTIVMGLAGALLLAIGIRAALLPWNEWVRGGSIEKQLPQTLVPRPSAPESTRESAAVAEQSSVPTAATAAKEKVGLIGNLRRRVYHLATCPDVRSMNAANRAPLKDAAEAAAKDLTPCGHCHPPTSAAAAKDGQGG